MFALPEQRQQAQHLAKEAGVPFVGIWVSAPEDVRINRIQSRKNNVSDVTPKVAERQSKFDLGAVTWSIVDSTGPKEATVLRGFRNFR